MRIDPGTSIATGTTTGDARPRTSWQPESRWTTLSANVAALMRRSLGVGLIIAVLIGLIVGVTVGAQVWRIARCQQLSNQYAAALSVPLGEGSQAFQRNQTAAKAVADAREAYQRECS
jgi:hypothetical protein